MIHAAGEYCHLKTAPAETDFSGALSFIEQTDKLSSYSDKFL